MEEIKNYIEDIISDSTIGKEKPDAIALLILYYNTLYPLHVDGETKHVTEIKVPDAMELLSISDRRVRKAKKILEDFMLLENISIKDPETKTIQHYIEMTT